MFFDNNDFRQNENMGYGENINIDIDNYNTNSNFNMNNYDMDNSNDTVMGTVEGPIVEPGRERIIQRNIIHEVKHACQFM